MQTNFLLGAKMAHTLNAIGENDAFLIKYLKIQQMFCVLNRKGYILKK